jgi:hypothetical protein
MARNAPTATEIRLKQEEMRRHMADATSYTVDLFRERLIADTSKASEIAKMLSAPEPEGRGAGKSRITASIRSANDARLRAAPVERLARVLGQEYIANIAEVAIQQDFRTDEWLMKVTRKGGGTLVVPFVRDENETGVYVSPEDRATLVLFLA